MTPRDRIVARKQAAQAIVDAMLSLLEEIDADADLAAPPEKPAVTPRTNAEPVRNGVVDRPQVDARPPTERTGYKVSDYILGQIGRALAARPMPVKVLVASSGVSRASIVTALRQRPDLFEKSGPSLPDPYRLTAAGREWVASSPATG
jgi:hypothetical protein